MSETYYSAEKHGYMLYSNDLLADYIYSLLPLTHVENFDQAVELGAGMGRFSAPVISNFKAVTLVEPSPDYAALLRDKFVGSSIKIEASTASSYMQTNKNSSPQAVFAFHLMHHLNSEERKEIFKFVYDTKSIGIAVEPNPINPLILVQVLCHPDMRIEAEKEYLKLNRTAYEKELTSVGLKLLEYKRILFMPPFMCNRAIQFISPSILSKVESLNNYLPFLSSYQVIVYGR